MESEYKNRKVAAIAAMDESRVIGVNNSLPWHIPQDLKHFSKATSGHTVLMGKNTYFSFPEKYRPLPNRKNIVATRDPSKVQVDESVSLCTNPVLFIEEYKNGTQKITGSTLWVIGGESIYRETIPYWDEVVLTIVPGHHEGDAFFPQFEDSFFVAEEIKGDECSFITYKRKED